MFLDEPVFVLTDGVDIFSIQEQLSFVRVEQEGKVVTQILGVLAQLYDETVLTVFSQAVTDFGSFVREQLKQNEEEFLRRIEALAAAIQINRNFNGELVLRTVGLTESATETLSHLPFIDHLMEDEEKDIFDEYIAEKTLNTGNAGWIGFPLFSIHQMYEIVSYNNLHKMQNWFQAPSFEQRLSVALMRDYSLFLAGVENFVLPPKDAASYSYSLHNIDSLPYSALWGEQLTAWRTILETKAAVFPLILNT